MIQCFFADLWCLNRGFVNFFIFIVNIYKESNQWNKIQDLWIVEVGKDIRIIYIEE